jgi:hypothetical protein
MNYPENCLMVEVTVLLDAENKVRIFQLSQ